MSFLRKRADSNPEEQERLTGKAGIARFSIGSALNLIISIDFLAIFIASLVVIGTVGVTQNQLSNCFLYSRCAQAPNTTGDCTGFNPGSTTICSFTMVAFSFVGIMGLAFVISLIVKAILHQDLNWTLFVEVPTLLVFVIFLFAIGVMLSIGIRVTCDDIGKYNNAAKNNITGCSSPFPGNANSFNPYSNMINAQNSTWFTFLFIVIGLVIYVIRLVVYLRRKKKRAILSTIEKEDFEETGEQENNPI